MLSRINTLILGMIAENPQNPYEITKYFEILELRKWMPIANSSIYAAIRKLNEKKYITGTVVQEGNMPEKTIYSITQSGKKVLNSTLEEIILNTGIDYITFNLAIMFICQLERDKALSLLKEKLSFLYNFYNRMEAQKDFVEKSNMSFIAVTAHKRNMMTLKAEIDTIEDLLNILPPSESWDQYLISDLNIGLNNINLYK